VTSTLDIGAGVNATNPALLIRSRGWVAGLARARAREETSGEPRHRSSDQAPDPMNMLVGIGAPPTPIYSALFRARGECGPD
jgi:hypothetical protein